MKKLNLSFIFLTCFVTLFFYCFQNLIFNINKNTSFVLSEYINYVYILIFIILNIFISFVFKINKNKIFKYIIYSFSLPTLLFSIIIKFNLYRFFVFANSNILGKYKYLFYIIIFLPYLILFYLFLLNIKSKIQIFTKKQTVIFILLIFCFLSFFSLTTAIDGDHGDEWLYLLLSKSIALDFDVNVKNNFPEKYQQNNGTLIFSNNKIYIRYFPLYSLLISPGNYLGKIIKTFDNNKLQKISPPIINVYNSLGARILNVFWSIITILFIYKTFLLFYSKEKSYFYSILFLFSSPFFYYTNQIYPEIISSAILSILIYIILKNQKTNLNNLLLIVSLSILMFILHSRNAVIFFITVCYSITNFIYYKKIEVINYKKTLFLLLFIIFLILFFLFYNKKIFNNYFPFKTYTGNIKSDSAAIEKISDIKSKFNMNPVIITKKIYSFLFDKKFGFILLYPFFFFSFISIFKHLINKKIKFLYLILLVFSHLFFISIQTLSNWNAGYSPIGRYFIIILFPLFFFFILNIKKLKNMLKYIFFYEYLFIILIILFPKFKFAGPYKINYLYFYISHIVNNIYLKFVFSNLNIILFFIIIFIIFYKKYKSIL